ncbi:MAG: hypothetical protein IJI67_08415 [Clostridia bacterium]|nr:hypothetical protein [Clostridia bacterium]
MCDKLSIFLSSTVLTALIAAIVTYVNFNKEARLKRITDERMKWRDSIRKIANQLTVAENGKRKEVFLVLTKLQLLINPNGKFDNTNIMSDGHIWELIDEIKKEEEINQEKIELLVLYLSALLKFDWERAKAEVKVSFFKCIKKCLIKKRYNNLVAKIQNKENNTCAKEETK